jgi:hypothetical protein
VCQRAAVISRRRGHQTRPFAAAPLDHTQRRVECAADLVRARRLDRFDFQEDRGLARQPLGCTQGRFEDRTANAAAGRGDVGERDLH